MPGAETQYSTAAPETKSSARAAPVREESALNRVLGGARGVGSVEDAARLLADPALDSRANRPLRVAILRDVQRKFGDRAARSVAAPASRAVPRVSAPSILGLAAGAPLAKPMRGRLEAGLGANLGGVRVHEGAQAATAANRFGAKAFASGSDIILGAGARADDLGLMAHEAAHTIQQDGNQGAQPFTASAGDVHEREARAASEAVVRGGSFSVKSRTGGAKVQRFAEGEALDFFAEQANLIPGFRMFTIVLGVNPVNMRPVQPSAANLLRALVEFIPGGGLITKALDSYGIFEKAGLWVEQQIKTLGMIGSAIRQSIMQFLGSLKWSDVFDLGGVWERAKRIFTEPIERIKNFAIGLATGILQIIKDAILRPLAKLAEGTAGYDLLKGVLGKDPITDEPVARTPDTLLGPFMKLIGQEEIWENMKKANAIPRAWAWFQKALEELKGFVAQIPGLAIAAFKSLEVADVILLPVAVGKIIKVFGGFLVKFTSWAGGTIWTLLEIIIESVKPGALEYIKKTGSALKSILKNPLPFMGNLIKAAKQGFLNFGNNILEHLKKGLIDWLTGSLPGVYIPKKFEIGEIVKFVFSVLGLTWQNVRQKLVKAVGETAVKVMETGFDIVVTLVREGPAAAWEKIKEQLGNLKDMVIGGITDFVIDSIVKKAVPKLIAMFIPGAGFISAIMSIYDTVMVFVNKLKQIAEVVTGFIDSIVAIAGGAIAAAAGKVESVLSNLLSLAISFLAGFLGLGNIADKIKAVIEKIRGTVDKALDALIAWIVKMGKAFLAKVGGTVTGANDTPEEKEKRVRDGADAAVAALSKYSGKRVGALILKPLLRLVQIRYRLTTLEPVQQGEDWYVRAEINPVIIKKTDAKAAGKDVAEVTIIYEPHWPLDEFRSKAGAIKSAAENKPVSAAKTLPMDITTGKQRSTRGARKGGQAAFRSEIHAFIDRVPDARDQQTARGLMSGLQADHQQELQMSGTDTASNMAMIESRMNSQLGAMFRAGLKNLSDEATLQKVDIKDDSAKPGQHRETGKARELETLLLKYALALKTDPTTVKLWFKL